MTFRNGRGGSAVIRVWRAAVGQGPPGRGRSLEVLCVLSWVVVTWVCEGVNAYQAAHLIRLVHRTVCNLVPQFAKHTVCVRRGKENLKLQTSSCTGLPHS